MPLVYLNGEFLDRERASIPLDDRGFLFGDGVYEVCRTVNGRTFELSAHWERLASGLDALAIRTRQYLDFPRFSEIGRRLLEENDLNGGQATIYLQVTRGAATRTHAYPTAETRPTVYASASAFEPPRELRRTGGAAITLADLRWARCDIKSVNLLPNVMAKQRAVEAGAFEAVLVRDGVITEGASSNVFGVLEGELWTHPLTSYILPGITREVVLQLARDLDIPLRERPILVEELPRLQELFATGTTTDVQPLVILDGRPVGDGGPGEIARALQARLDSLLSS